MQINKSNSTVNFTVKKLLFLTVNGTLPEVIGNVEMSGNNLSDSKIELRIPLAGIDTKNKKRDKHLLQKDFFKAEQFPEITFNSTVINKQNNSYSAKGELSISGTTKTIEIPFQFDNNRATGKFNLSRKDFKIGNLPSLIVAENVAIAFDCSLV